MPELNAAALELLESAALAHLVTLDADGAPQVSGVWVGIEDGEICFASLRPRRKLDNLRRDPRVSLSIEAPTRDPLGYALSRSPVASSGTRKRCR